MAEKISEQQIKEREMQTRLEEIQKTGEVTIDGRTRIDEKVIGAIAGSAAREIEGVAKLGKSSIRRTISEAVGGTEKRAEGVQIEAGAKEAIIELDLHVKYGYSIPDIIVAARKKMASRVLEYTGLFAKEINIRVVGLEFSES